MPSSFEIVIAKPEDAHAIRHIQRLTWLATYPSQKQGITRQDIESKDFESHEKIEKIKKLIQDNSSNPNTWVAKIEDNEIVGFGVATHTDNEMPNQLNALYVLPEHQGIGVGAGMMLTMLDYLGNEKEISLGVVQYNKQAISFYQRFGFVVTGEHIEHEKPTFPNGVDMPEIEMRRKPLQ